MILQALNLYYGRLESSANAEIACPGFSSEKIHFALVIGNSGNLVQVLDLRELRGNRKIPRTVIVPQGAKKSVNISANFLWGSTAYVLGADDKEKPRRTAECHKAFKELHKDLLESSDDDGAKAIIAFLSQWDPSDFSKLNQSQEMLASNVAFQLDGEHEFIHERPAIKRIWLDSLAEKEQGETAMCLINGEIAPIARLHPAIKGVKGAQSSGAAVVSFNKDAFCSYDKSQNFNAPVCEYDAFSYATALNYLLRSDSKNRIQIGDATTVFWTERDSPIEGFLGMILDPRDTAGDDRELAVFLQAIREGKLPSGIDPNIKFYILGLSPNASRLSVRFWHASNIGDISQKLGQHFQDIAMIRSFDDEPEFPGMWRLLRETSNQKSKDGRSPLLAGAIMQAILKGTPYPQQLLTAVIGRIRADQNINYMRAAIIKAVLVRKKRILNQGLEVPMTLDKDNKNTAYLLGRLFAVLEKAQQDAIPGANTTIKDRFYGSASATPRTVFPQLLRLAQHHIAKAEFGGVRDRQIEEILCDVREFPAHLGLDQQGFFAIGYYQQRQDIYKKSGSKQLENEKEA